jgi:hypothetical protein
MLRSTLTVLIAITGISSLRIAFFPRSPEAALPQVRLERITQAQALDLEELPGQRTRDWALSLTRRYSLRPIGKHQQSSAISLSLTGLTVRRRQDFQIESITNGNPTLGMDQIRVHQTTHGDEYAMGMIGGLDALQSCKVFSGRSGVTKQTLEQLTRQQPFDPYDLQHLGDRLRRLAGLQSNRNHECVLITLISSESGQSDQLFTLWREVLESSKEKGVG